MIVSAQKIRFQKTNLIAIIVLFLVILAGGVVRSSGSGMGCPDWPKCFGRYVPPTDVSQLPKDYKQKYVDKRVAKNQRFAKLLDALGYHDLATRLRHDKSILVPEDFNAANTWTEYANRLAGVLSGFALIFTAVFSFSYRKESFLIPFLSVLNLIFVIIQAWLGSIVVSTNLVSWIVTVHMLLALVIIAISIYTYHLSKVIGKPSLLTSGITRLIAFIVIVISVIQIVVGTEVREKIDSISARLGGQYREDWVAEAGNIFHSHRTLAIVVLVANVMLYALIRKSFNRHSLQQQLMSFTFLMIMLQIGTGIALSYLALPPFAQATHILLASMAFGAQFYLFLNLYRCVKRTEVGR